MSVVLEPGQQILGNSYSFGAERGEMEVSYKVAFICLFVCLWLRTQMYQVEFFSGDTRHVYPLHRINVQGQERAQEDFSCPWDALPSVAAQAPFRLPSQPLVAGGRHLDVSGLFRQAQPLRAHCVIRHCLTALKVRGWKSYLNYFSSSEILRVKCSMGSFPFLL